MVVSIFVLVFFEMGWLLLSVCEIVVLVMLVF